MRYKTRPGVVKVQICGSYLLVPNREASEYCQGVVQLKMLQTMGWEVLEAGGPVKDVYKLFSIFMRQPEEEVRSTVDTFLSRLREKGFLIAEDEL